MNKEFKVLSENELFEIEGGMPFIVGILAAGGIIAGSANE